MFLIKNIFLTSGMSVSDNPPRRLSSKLAMPKMLKKLPSSASSSNWSLNDSGSEIVALEQLDDNNHRKLSKACLLVFYIVFYYRSTTSIFVSIFTSSKENQRH